MFAEFDVQDWECTKCTFINENHHYICEICGDEKLKWSLKELNPDYKVENKKEKVKKVFGKTTKIFLPVLACSTYEQFCNNIDNLFPYVNNEGLSGIFLISSDYDNKIIEEVFIYSKKKYPSLWVGVNLLSRNPYTIANFLHKYKPDGLWMDQSFISSDKYQNIPEYFLNIFKKCDWHGLYFGGTLFKYQPDVCDKETVIKNSLPFMDIITTSGDATSIPISLDKLKLVSSNLKNTNIIATASGNNIDTIKRDISNVNIFLFRSYFVDNDDNYIIEKIEKLLQL